MMDYDEKILTTFFIIAWSIGAIVVFVKSRMI